MSQETSKWLNTNTLIGFTEKRGQAWHYRAEEQGAESNHYVGAIPVADVKRRLFGWQHAVGNVSASYTIVGPDGLPVDVTLTEDNRVSVMRPVGTFGPDDKGEILGLFKEGYRVHPFGEWLVDNVSTILDDDLAVGSAGLLKGGAIAWVQCEMPESVETPEGVTFRPFLTAATSVNGSLATTYQTGVQVVVCDNTLSAALGEKGAARVKIQHRSRSLGRITEVRQALDMVYGTADAFAAEVAELSRVEVTAKQWQAFVEAHAPIDPQAKTTRNATIATRTREQLTQLWNSDTRVSPWKGTAWGVVQAVNTWQHHLQGGFGGSRVERNMLRSVTGQVDKDDQSTLDLLQKVLVTV